MKTMNNTNISRELFDGFEGIPLAPASEKAPCRLDNFRVLADGSLEKREGIRQIASLPLAVRGIYAFAYDGREVILAVAGNCLYCISAKDGQVTFSSCLDSEEGEVGFFVYGGRLYLLDGLALYRYEGGCTATRLLGYTPLYGKNWRTYSSCDNLVNEPINYLSPRIRIHYLLDGPVDFVYVGMEIEAVEWLSVDGILLNAGRYQLSDAKDTLYFSGGLSGGELEICVTLQESYYKDSDFISCRSAAVYEDFENSRIFLYGGDDPSRLFFSREISAEAKRQDAEMFSGSCGLYFPKIQEFSFGSGQPITAIHRIYDRMMVFFPSALWVSEPLDSTAGYELLFSPICHHMGCSAHGALLMTGAASPISVTLGGVYRWKIDPDFLDECIIKCLSDGILSQLDESFFENAEVCYHRRRSELWFYDRIRRDGKLFLYDLDRELWYCYSGVSVERLFVYNGGVGFFEGGRVCLFDEALATDSYADEEREIEAVFESGYLDFGGVETDKRLEEAVLVAELRGGGLSICIGDERVLSSVKLSEADAAAPMIYEPRLPTGRFRAAKLTLCADGPFKQRIYRAELFAQKGKK